MGRLTPLGKKPLRRIAARVVWRLGKKTNSALLQSLGRRIRPRKFTPGSFVNRDMVWSANELATKRVSQLLNHLKRFRRRNSMEDLDGAFDWFNHATKTVKRTSKGPPLQILKTNLNDLTATEKKVFESLVEPMGSYLFLSDWAQSTIHPLIRAEYRRRPYILVDQKGNLIQSARNPFWHTKPADFETIRLRFMLLLEDAYAKGLSKRVNRFYEQFMTQRQTGMIETFIRSHGIFDEPDKP